MVREKMPVRAGCTSKIHAVRRCPWGEEVELWGLRWYMLAREEKVPGVPWERRSPQVHHWQADLTKALKKCEDSSGSFFSLKSYPDAPNPFILLDGHCVLGLPLPELQAQRLLQTPATQQYSTTHWQMATQTSCSVVFPSWRVRA